MHFIEVECSEATADKLWSKHRVDVAEVDEVLSGRPYVRRGRDELLYVLGQTEGGRYLFVVVRKASQDRARLVTAREMTPAERRLYQDR